MVSTKALSLLAFAASALAAPAPRQHKKVVWHTVIHTAYVTVPYGYQPEKTSTSTKTPPAVPTTTVVYVPPTSTPVYEEAPKPTTTKTSTKPSSTSTTPAYTPPPSSTVVETPTETATPNDGYMAIVDEWRGKLGLSNLKQDSTLEANALKTAREGNGQMVHQLNPGSMGQVLAPGQPDEFYHVFVGGWLCEKPNMAGMNGVCSSASEGWYYTSTGHADILTSPSYSKIGCGCEGGIWACDLA